MNHTKNRERVSYLGSLSAFFAGIGAALSQQTIFERLDFIAFSTNYIFLPFFLLLASFIIFKKKGFNSKLLLAISLLLGYAVITSLPSNINQPFNIGLVAGILATSALLLLPRRYAEKAANVFITTIAVLSVVVVATFFFLISPVDVPYIDYGEPRSYRLYFTGTAALPSNLWASPWGGTFIRSMGIYGEPGHYAVIAGSAWVLTRCDLSTWRGQSIFLGGFLSFSSAFAVIAIISYFALHANNLKRVFLATSVFALLFVLLLLFAPEQLTHRFFRHFGSFLDGTLFDDRLEMPAGFESLINSLAIWIFSGSDHVDTTSNFWGYLSSQGLLSFFLLLVFIVSLWAAAEDRFLFFVLSLSLMVVFLHRSWMYDHFWFFFCFAVGARLGIPSGTQKTAPKKVP